MSGRSGREARIAYYVDADVLGLAQLLVQVRSDVTYPGDAGGICPNRRLRPQCPITQSETPDDEWIPVVAANGWIVITKDSAIGSTLRLRNLANEHRSRLIAIASGRSKRKMHTWEHLVAIASHWHRIENLVDQPGPWMFRASRSTLSRVPGVGVTP